MPIASLSDSSYIRRIRELYPNVVFVRLIDDIDYPYHIPHKVDGGYYIADGKPVVEIRMIHKYPLIELRIKWVENGQMKQVVDQIRYHENV